MPYALAGIPATAAAAATYGALFLDGVSELVHGLAAVFRWRPTCGVRGPAAAAMLRQAAAKRSGGPSVEAAAGGGATFTVGDPFHTRSGAAGGRSAASCIWLTACASRPPASWRSYL